MTAIGTVPLDGASASAATLVHLSGDIDILTTTRLRRRLLGILDHSTSLFVLDMSEVTFFGAGGLGVLVGVQGRAQAQGITLALTGLTPPVARLLRITGLDCHFPIVV
ncbi:STAS domain-containing protein [Streptosporangium saharense]|uniref:STAS domain-containing protein n=1 Tax=Streptosporangium saharense TaxID=1706840 RepID=UPI00342E3E2A